jgi:hypothetical protein
MKTISLLTLAFMALSEIEYDAIRDHSWQPAVGRPSRSFFVRAFSGTAYIAAGISASVPTTIGLTEALTRSLEGADYNMVVIADG